MSDTNGEAIAAVVSVVGAVIGVATLAVFLGKNSQTASVIGAAGSALATLINAAVSPVTGGNVVGTGSALGNAFEGAGISFANSAGTAAIGGLTSGIGSGGSTSDIFAN